MRRRGARWLLWRGGAGGGAPDAESLLDEAPVRFDFSQYSDINDMVDVNGGWGPIAVDGSPIFADGGLQWAGASGWGISPVASPLSFGPDGFTYLDVILDSHGEDTASDSNIASDGGDDFAPQLQASWDLPISGVTEDDSYGVAFYDVAPGYETIVDTDALIPNVSAAAVPIQRVVVCVVDVVAAEIRWTMAAGGSSETVVLPFDKSVPDFVADPRQIDTLFWSSNTNATHIEWNAWNRALTEAEADALVAHFTA